MTPDYKTLFYTLVHAVSNNGMLIAIDTSEEIKEIRKAIEEDDELINIEFLKEFEKLIESGKTGTSLRNMLKSKYHKLTGKSGNEVDVIIDRWLLRSKIKLSKTL